jgi:hypothetical protein
MVVYSFAEPRTIIRQFPLSANVLWQILFAASRQENWVRAIHFLTKIKGLDRRFAMRRNELDRRQAKQRRASTAVLAGVYANA